MLADVMKYFNPAVSWVMTLLGIISIISIAIIIERFLYFSRRRVAVNQFFEKIKETFTTGGRTEAIAFTKNYDNPVSNVAKTGFENYDLPEDLLIESMETTILEEKGKFERFLGGMNTIGTVSPLLGLLGTVIGLIKAFMQIAITGAGGPGVVARGIGEALYTTMVGLMIAVPVVYFYNYFTKKSDEYTDAMESTLRKMIRLIKASKSGEYEGEKIY